MKLCVDKIAYFDDKHGNLYHLNRALFNVVGGYQGDVALSDGDLRHLRARRYGRAVTNEKERKWPNGIIPYEISNDFNGKL